MKKFNLSKVLFENNLSKEEMSVLAAILEERNFKKSGKLISSLMMEKETFLAIVKKLESLKLINVYDNKKYLTLEAENVEYINSGFNHSSLWKIFHKYDLTKDECSILATFYLMMEKSFMIYEPLFDVHFGDILLHSEYCYDDIKRILLSLELKGIIETSKENFDKGIITVVA